MNPVYPRMTATYGYVWWYVMSQLVLGVRRAVYSWKEWRSEKKKKRRKRKKEWTSHRTAVSQGIKLSLYLVSVCLTGTTRKTEGDILVPEWNNIQGDTTVSSPLLSFCLSPSLWAQWSPPRPRRWCPPARSWPAAVGPPERGELPAGCWSATRAPAATASARSPDA